MYDKGIFMGLGAKLQAPVDISGFDQIHWFVLMTRFLSIS